MATHLGVAATSPRDLDASWCAGVMVYLEGYLWDSTPAKEAMRRATDVAHARRPWWPSPCPTRSASSGTA